MDRTRANSAVSDDFFALIPRRAIVVFHAAVFSTFAPIGMLFASRLEPERSFLAVATSMIVSGLLAVSWAATFTMYTDGLNETEGASGEELGHDAIEELLISMADRPLDKIHRAVSELVERFGEQNDDRTLLLMRYLGAARPPGGQPTAGS